LYALEGSTRSGGYGRASSRPVVYIFDTAAFLSALQLYIYGGEIVAPPAVVQEVKDSESVSRLEIALTVDRFRVEEPSRQSVEKAMRAALSIGLSDKLSQADLEVVALALEYRSRGYRPVVFTDDYDVQRVLKSVGIEYKPVKNLGIDKR